MPSSNLPNVILNVWDAFRVALKLQYAYNSMWKCYYASL